MAEILDNIGEYVKEHPAVVVGVVIVAGLGIYLLLNSGSSQSTAQGGSTVDPNVLAFQSQQDQIAAAASSQASSQNFQLTQQTNQIAGQLALAQEEGNINIAEQNTAAGVTNNQNANEFQLGMAEIAAQLSGLQSNNATSVNLAQIAANTNTTIANIQAQEQDTIAGINGNVQINESNNAAKVEINASNNAASTAQSGQLFGFLGGIF